MLRALPNSLRTVTFGASSAVEMVNTIDGARYRDEFGGIYVTDPDFVLDFTDVDSSFNLLGSLNNPADFNPANRIVIYNTSDNIYAEALGLDDQGSITNAGTSLAFTPLNPGVNQEYQITMVPPFQFTRQSPGQRAFFVDGPISYGCNPGSGIEWGIHESLVLTPGCPATSTFTVPAGASSNFAVTVACSESSHTEATTTITTYQITAIARSGNFGSLDYVQRRMQATVSANPP